MARETRMSGPERTAHWIDVLRQWQKVGVYLYTIPPMTAVVAALYLGETITANLIIGAVLVIGGVALTERG